MDTAQIDSEPVLELTSDMMAAPNRTSEVPGTIVVITSGKGGVGKTTTTASLGTALALLGDTVVVVDFDVGLRKLDLILGAERGITYDIIDVIEGRATLDEALVNTRSAERLKLLPASQTFDKSSLTSEGVSKVVADLAKRFRWVLCDSPAGIEAGARMAMQDADLAIVVVNPEVASIRDSDRIIGLLETELDTRPNRPKIDKHLLITRYSIRRAAKKSMLTTQNIEQRLSIPIIGVIPESEEVLDASNVGCPVTVSHPKSQAGKAYLATARRLRGEIVLEKPPGFLQTFFKR